MFTLTLSPGPTLEVQSRHHTHRYATDGSLANPLESAHASLAGCAGVYARKACRELGIDDTGIRIGVRIVSRPAQPLVPSRIVTTVEFPDRFDDAQRAAVLASIDKCPVKLMIQHGGDVEFALHEAALSVAA